MSWSDWEPLFEGMACSAEQEAGIVCCGEEAAPQAACEGGRVWVFLQGRILVSRLIWVGRRS